MKSASKYLFITGGPTSVGKTTIAAVCADWAQCRGKSIHFLDYDNFKRGSPTSFGNFAKDQKGALLNAQDEDDLDGLLKVTSDSSADCTFADMPGNAAHDGSLLSRWWMEMGMSSEFDFYGIRLITVVPVVAMPGSTQAAQQWMHSVGSQGTFLVALNRLAFSLYEKKKEELFKEWLSVNTNAFDVRTIEIPHLNGSARDFWIASRRLPSKEEPSDDRTFRNKIRRWTKTIHDQLDLTGILEEKTK